MAGATRRISFRYLTQAATKLERTAIVASLLATDPRKSDDTGQANH